MHHFQDIPFDFISTYFLSLCVVFLCLVIVEKTKRDMYLVMKKSQELEIKQRDILQFIPDPLIKVNIHK